MPRVVRNHARLSVLFFLHGAALSAWFVPLSAVLDAHGLHGVKPFAFAASAIAAFVSPLVFGAMADRHASPVLVLRGLAVATALAMVLASTAIRRMSSPSLVLALIQLHALCSAPTWGISSTIVLGRLGDSAKEFGSIRAMATLGWLAGCWLVSLMNADASTLSGYVGAVLWLAVCAFTFFLPGTETPAFEGRLTWHERLGLDGLKLMKNPDHRVVFVTVALFSIPLAGFYPYAPAHLRDAGFRHISAWMSLGQVTEVMAMFSLGTLILSWRLKTIFALGLGFGVLRFALSALPGSAGLLAGVVLHGCSFSLVVITAQIYLDQRVSAAWRARAQALMSLMSSGVGNLIGYLGTGAWFNVCTPSDRTDWPRFWGVLAICVVVVMAYFLAAFRGLKHGPMGVRERR